MKVRNLLCSSVVASAVLATVIGFARADDHGHAPAPAAHADAHDSHGDSHTAPAARAKPAEDVAPDADKAFAILRAGNARFVMGTASHPHDDAARRAATAKDGQKPFVGLLSCADSRVPAELVFDAGVGDLFVVRVAGNIACTSEIATLEYGAEHLKTPLIVVMGHTKCGAVTAAVNHAKVGGSLPSLLAHIEPAVATAKADHPRLSDAELVPVTIQANVNRSIQDLLQRSEILRSLVAQGKLRVVGAVYDIATGKVEWTGEHPQQTALLGTEKPTTDELVHDVAKPAHVDAGH